MAPGKHSSRLHRLIVLLCLVAIAAAVWLLWLFNSPNFAPPPVAPNTHSPANETTAAPAADGNTSDLGTDGDSIAESDPFAELRGRMVDRQLRDRDITDNRVLSVMRRIPRHEFVPADLRNLAYEDRPLPIGHNQTISQPYIVALMTQLARPKPGCTALDIGTGSGYQAAVLADLAKQVYSIEILRPLADSARRRLKRLGYTNVEVICGDGYRGMPQHAPFDVIIVAAAPEQVPEPLIEQLAVGGRLVIPVGSLFQDLMVIEKRSDGTIHSESVAAVAFVPMTGEAREPND